MVPSGYLIDVSGAESTGSVASNVEQRDPVLYPIHRDEHPTVENSLPCCCSATRTKLSSLRQQLPHVDTRIFARSVSIETRVSLGPYNMAHSQLQPIYSGWISMPRTENGCVALQGHLLSRQAKVSQWHLDPPRILQRTEPKLRRMSRISRCIDKIDIGSLYPQQISYEAESEQAE